MDKGKYKDKNFKELHEFLKGCCAESKFSAAFLVGLGSFSKAWKERLIDFQNKNTSQAKKLLPVALVLTALQISADELKYHVERIKSTSYNLSSLSDQSELTLKKVGKDLQKAHKDFLQFCERNPNTQTPPDNTKAFMETQYQQVNLQVSEILLSRIQQFKEFQALLSKRISDCYIKHTKIQGRVEICPEKSSQQDSVIESLLQEIQSSLTYTKQKRQLKQDEQLQI